MSLLLTWRYSEVPWAYGEKLISLSVENAAALVEIFFRAGYCQVVLSSGIHSQKELDALSTLVHTDYRMLYVWLDVDKTARDKRRIARSRDAADKAESLDYIDSVVTDPGDLKISNGVYYRLSICGETPQEVLERVVETLTNFQKESLHF